MEMLKKNIAALAITNADQRIAELVLEILSEKGKTNK
jgi:hypothetical protein